MNLAPGRTFGRFQLLAPLGAGGMGEVWRARDTRLGRDVAVKFLPERLSQRSRDLARFEQEARAASSLNHPNLVTVHDVGTVEEHAFIVLELIEGQTLREMLRARARPMSLRRLLHVATQIAEGMARAHAAGIVHRDLKPENVMVTADGLVKILDFGLAKLTAPDGSGAAERAEAETASESATPLDAEDLAPGPETHPGSLLGTPAYMAPEQVRGAALDYRADQFAFGAILWELATGRPAFRRTSQMLTLAAILDEQPESLTTAAPAVPPPLRWIVERCLAKSPADRYASTLDLARELRNLRDHLGETSASAAGSDERPPFSARRLVRPAALATIGAALVLVALGVVAWRTLRPSLPEQKRLAVLAAPGAGASDADRAFGDGLAETLSSRLTQIERFQGSFWVVPLSEVRRAGADSAAAARRALGANLAIALSVQRIGSRLRLTANLIDATDLRQLRALSFDSPVADLAALQDDFVRRVGEMLDLEVGGAAREVLDAGRTGDSGAYHAYLRGRGHLLAFQDPANVEAAIADFQQALQRDDDFALAYAGLGEAYWRLWELRHEPEVVELARRACLRAVQLNDLLAPVHVTLGLLDRGTGRPESALEAFDTALRLDPASAAARRERARTLEDLGRRSEAEEAHRDAIRLRPGDWASHNALGRFLWIGGRVEEAAEQFRRVTEIAPDNARGWTNLGGMYQLLGRYEEARAAHERAVALQPNPNALSNLATLEYFLGDFARAARTFERAVELEARSYKLWQNLAAARYWAPGERERAAEGYRRAVELIGEALEVNPRDAVLLADRAECRAMLGEGAAARGDAERALALAPGDTQVAFRVAFVWERLGEREKALERLGFALAGGYPPSEIEAHPGFAALRADPRYRGLRPAAEPPAGGTPSKSS